MNAQWKIGLGALAAAAAATTLLVACQTDVTSSPSASVRYVAQLSGVNEVPTVAGGATGTATFTLTGRMISYVVTVNGLSGNAAASHIHIGAGGTNGNIVYPFTAAAVQNGEVAAGTIDLTQPISNGTTSISGDSLLTLFNTGGVYTNVHTAANPNGEIRGQITRVQSAPGY